MSVDLQELQGWPSTGGNFVIPYQATEILTKQDTDNLLRFIESDVETHLHLSGIDSNFFPRAFTDKDLNDLDHRNGNGPHKLDQAAVKPKVIKASDKKAYGARTTCNEMDEINSNLGTTGFQPDVVMISSYQRPGPDGSPALVPSGSQGFLPTGNLSETGELFAPVRQLTFSDIDQNSQIEDNYAERSVSTPTRHVGGISKNSQNELVNGLQGRINSDSSQEDSSEERELSPDFRQLDGEADSQTDMLSTGIFNPTAMGLNKEFLDNFTGRNSGGRMNLSSDVFSPLGSRDIGFRHENGVGQASRTITPPLHSPRINSPYHKSPVRNSLHHIENYSARSTLQQATDQQELQFSMSPTRNQPDFMPYHYNQPDIDILNHQYHSGINYQYDSHGQIDSSVSVAVPLHIRQSVSVGEERKTDSEVVTSAQRQTQCTFSKPSQENHAHQENRTNSTADNRIVEEVVIYSEGDLSPEDEVQGEGHQYSSVPPAVFQERYLQRTTVSVKLPQATYDSMGAEFTAQGAESYDDVEPRLNHNSNHQHQEPGNDTSSKKVHIDSSKQETNEHRQFTERSKSVDQHDPNQRKNKKQPEKFHMEMKRIAENQNSVNQGEKSKDLNKNMERNGAKASNGSKQISNGSDVGSDNKSHNATAKLQPYSIPAPQTGAALNPSSRLLQETVSQKNKTSQKFASNASSRLVNEQHGLPKEFKKPRDVGKNVTVPSCSGARKTLMDSNTDKGAKLKIRSTSGTVAPHSNKQPGIVNSSVTSKSSGPGTEDLKVSPARRSEQSKQQSSLNNSHESAEGDGHTGKIGQVVTQVEKTSPVADRSHTAPVVKSLQSGDSSVDLQGMEDVRHQLQGMLRLSHDNLSGVDRSQYEHSDIVAGYAGDFGRQDFQRNADLSWNILRKSQEEDLVENFPSFSSQFMVDSGNVSRSDVSLQSENQRLRDLLEKERYRRKHCENYIQQLNVKLLETQQQVAVAVSTDKRKDIMIEQLDKQLARVVEGWKKRDIEKDELLEHARQEKEEVEDKLKKQDQMIGHFEHDMSQAVDALRQEKDRSAQAVEELNVKISEADRAKSHAEEQVSVEQEKSSLLQQECDSLREARENLDKKLDQMQRRLHREQDEWFQREQELLQRIEEVSEKNAKILQTERSKNEEQGKLAEEIMEQYQTACTKVKKLELDLDAAMREKESMKVEIGIMEAKFENAQRVLEADLQATMEKQISDQISDVQKRMEKSEDELREKHREQVVELNQRHKRELEKVQTQVREGLHKKEEEFRKQLQELESRLQEYREENSNLKLAKQKLESQRLEILTKLQYMMQSQWNEALTLLSTATPQRRRNPTKESQSTETSTTVNDSIQTVQSIPTVNFNLHSPCRPPPQDKAVVYSPGQDSVISHSTAKDEVTEATDEARDIETTATAHLREFQDYINSITQAPDWISSLDTQDQTLPPRVQTPNLPTPPELAALLQSHLQNIQHQQLVPRAVTTHPHHLETSQIPPPGRPVPNFSERNTEQSTGNGQNLSPTRNKTLGQNLPQMSQSQIMTPPRPKPGKSFPAGMSQVAGSQSESSMDPSDKKSLQGFSPIYGEFSRDAGWNGSRAVPIRPPQQGEDPYQQGDEHIARSSHMQGYFQGGQSFSPPTKQSNVTDRRHHDESIESIHSLTDHTTRLNEDYSQLSEKIQQHESHQNELQHYIQMLLNKSPGDGEHNESVDSQDNTQELDLNDTAQAAQLQRELDRIQELRQKQEASQRGRDTVQAQPEKESAAQPQGAEGQSKILNQDQMAEIAKMLNKVKDQGQSEAENPQIAELIEMLKHMQASHAGGDQKKGQKHSPKPGHGRGDKHKGLVGVKRNVQFQPAKGLDVSRQSESSVKSGKSASSKKVERKVAPSATNKGDKGNKPAAWK